MFTSYRGKPDRGEKTKKDDQKMSGEMRDPLLEKVPPIQHHTIDMTVLSRDEEEKLLNVMGRDIGEATLTEAKIKKLRTEMQSIRKAGALSAGDKQFKICARCKFKFWLVIVPFADKGKRCYQCHFKVCKKCRHMQPNKMFLCSLCLRSRQETWLTGEWLSPGGMDGLYGSSLLQASLRDKRLREEEEMREMQRRQWEIDQGLAPVQRTDDSDTSNFNEMVGAARNSKDDSRASSSRRSIRHSHDGRRRSSSRRKSSAIANESAQPMGGDDKRDGKNEPGKDSKNADSTPASPRTKKKSKKKKKNKV